MTYTWRSLNVDDVDRWSELTKILADYDGTQEIYSPEDLVEELELNETDPALDTWAVLSADGELAAFGQLSYRSALVEGSFAANAGGGVHPDHRGQRIGSQLVRRFEERSLTVGDDRAPGTPVTVRLGTGVQVADARRLFTGHGYIEQRFFFEMEHDLVGVDAIDQLPPAVRVYRLGSDDAPVLAAHTTAFAQHWRAAPWSGEEWANRITRARSFRPQLSFVATVTSPLGAEEADDEITGYVMSFEYVPGQLYVGLLGVLPHGRNRGTGTALLRATLSAAAGAGYGKVGLDVDSANSTGAGRLYEAVGFSTVRSTVSALKTLPALRPEAADEAG